MVVGRCTRQQISKRCRWLVAGVCGKASRQLGTMHANLASGSGRATGTACDGGKIGAVCVAFLLKRRRTTTRNTALGATRHHVQRSVSVTRFLHTTLCNRHGGVQRRTGVRKQKAIVCVIFKLNDQKAHPKALKLCAQLQHSSLSTMLPLIKSTLP